MTVALPVDIEGERSDDESNGGEIEEDEKYDASELDDQIFYYNL